MALKIYVASSWRNAQYEGVIVDLKSVGFQVWNWRQPPTGGNGFAWNQCGISSYEHGDKIGPTAWRRLLSHPVAMAGFASDLCGMNWCDVGVMLHPCGRSAHLEAGWIAGRGKKVHVLALEPVEPDLMVLALNGEICADVIELVRALRAK